MQNTRDWLWAIFIYFLGEVLEIKKYRPIKVKHASGITLMKFPFKTTPSRHAKLMQCWGCRGLSVEQVKKVLEHEAPSTKYEIQDLTPWMPAPPTPK